MKSLLTRDEAALPLGDAKWAGRQYAYTMNE